MAGAVEYLDSLAGGKDREVNLETWGGIAVAAIGAGVSIAGALFTWRSKSRELDQGEGTQLRKELREENVSLKAETREKDDLIEALRDQNEELKKQNVELKRQNESLSQQIEILKKDAIEVQLLQADVGRLTREITQIKKVQKGNYDD